MEEFIGPTPNNPIDAARFLSFLNLTAVLAVMEGFYCKPLRHRHSLKPCSSSPLYKLKRFRFLTEI